MSDMNFVFILLIFFATFLLARLLTVLLHELGHALPALLLTKQKVTVYIGSYGDPKNTLKLNLGMMEIFFRYNPLAWKIGMCVPSAKTISINRQIIYILAGPLTSITIAAFAFYFSFVYDLHGFLKLFLVIFLGSAFCDFLFNLLPSERSVGLYHRLLGRHALGYRLQR